MPYYYIHGFLAANSGTLDFYDKIINFDKLIMVISLYALLFIITCFGGGVDNIVACLFVNFITTFITGIRD